MMPPYSYFGSFCWVCHDNGAVLLKAGTFILMLTSVIVLEILALIALGPLRSSPSLWVMGISLAYGT